MKTRQMLAMAAVGVLIACGVDPETYRVLDTAEGFWDASQNGEVDVAQSYVAEGAMASLERREDGSAPFEEYSLGKVEVDGNSATVETHIKGINGPAAVEAEFQTVLVRDNGIWWIDLDRTTGGILESIMGETMAAMGEAMEEAMGEAMQEMVDGMQKSMEEMASKMNKGGQRR